jgi:hypothetical protein
MKMARSAGLVAILAVTCTAASVRAQLPGQPSWRAGAERFDTRDAVIYADGKPFLLIYDFTWSAEKNADLYEFAEDWGNTTTYGPLGSAVLSAFPFEQMDALYQAAADHHVYYSWAGSVMSDGGFIAAHPEAAMVGPDGEPVGRGTVCFLNPTYREHLGKRLAEVARSLRDRPFQLGYYPQDEFAYRSWGCHCPICQAEFRRQMRVKYNTVEALNQAWGSELRSFDDIELPAKPEKTVRFCDWQEFRRWSHLDFAQFVYDTLKEHDPGHLVIWSLPFWGSVSTTAAWWDFPRCTDVLMRHGIGYTGGAYRIHLLRDVAEWSGKPGNALCMPPDYNPGYLQMSFIMDTPRTGLSHVCIAGTPEPTYQGVADPSRDWERREPGYTVSKSINNVMYQLGDLYLQSRQREPQVGLYVSDRTVLVNGTDTRELNGILQMLGDLNVDFRIFSEHNLGELSRFPVIIVGQYSRCVSEEIAANFRDYVAGGGKLVMFDGAFAGDWYNRDAGSPGFGFEEIIGSTQREAASRTEAMTCDAEAARGVLLDLPEETPVAGEVSIREPAEGTRVIGSLPEDEAIVTLHDYGQGKALYIGARAGAIYQASWTEGFRDVLETDERAAALDDNAYGYDFRPPAGAELPPSKGTKAWAQMLRGFLRGCGVQENVRVAGYTDGIGVLKVKSFRAGDSYWLGFANRLLNPELDFKATDPREFHQVLHDLKVEVRLDEGTRPQFAWLLPNTRRTGGGRAALPQVLPVEIIEAGGEVWATFTLPELVDFAAVALMTPGERPAVVGIATDREALATGGTLTARGVIINTSAQRIRGTIEPGLEAGLVLVGEAQAFDLQPREEASFPFRVSAPEGLAPDYYQMNMVARLEDGTEIASPAVELHVQRDIIIEVASERTIFPLGHLAPVLPVSVQVNTVERSDLRVSAELPDGFSAEPKEHSLPPLSGGEKQQVQFTFSAEDDTPRVAEGTLAVAGTLRGKPFSRSYPVRLACGAVIYHKMEKYKLGASTPVEPRPLLCLENSKVLATVIEGSGVVHDLILRDTYTDHLVPSEYPFGLVWYGFGGWQMDEMSGCGESIWARLRGTTKAGEPVTMTYALNDGDNHLTVAVETGDAGPVPIPFYLMSRIGVDGRDERTLYPTADGIKEIAWRRGTRTLTPDQLSVTWLAVQDDALGQTFGCVYQFPSLDRVNLAPGQSNFNYMIFYPREDVPIGDITFHLSATLGDVQEVIELHDRLLGN